jgi:hypothetical protein
VDHPPSIKTKKKPVERHHRGRKNKKEASGKMPTAAAMQRLTMANLKL